MPRRPTAGARLSAAALPLLLLVGPPLSTGALLIGPSPFERPLIALVAVCAQMLLFTGLFITVHDAIHGSLAPRWPRMNHALGRLGAVLYAGFSYRTLRENHHAHHAHVGSAEDPDGPGGRERSGWRWALRFARHYVTLTQIVWMAALFNLLHHLAAVPLGHLWVYWLLPLLLSTAQLFVVGTWLVHRQRGKPFFRDTHARSLGLPRVLSLLACFHFGCHAAHHARPHVPWWRLYDEERAL